MLSVEKICYNKLAVKEQKIKGRCRSAFDMSMLLECEYRQRKEQKMELLIIRHGDPDYTMILLPKGWGSRVSFRKSDKNGH